MPELFSLDLAIFLFGTIAAAFVTSLSGFAFAMVAAAIWLYALSPAQASALIAACLIAAGAVMVATSRSAIASTTRTAFGLAPVASTRSAPPASGLPLCSQGP